jgi:hypothetical protein
MQVGLNVGRARGGHVVKIERIGLADIVAPAWARTRRPRICTFTYPLPCAALTPATLSMPWQVAMCETPGGDEK